MAGAIEPPAPEGPGLLSRPKKWKGNPTTLYQKVILLLITLWVLLFLLLISFCWSVPPEFLWSFREQINNLLFTGGFVRLDFRSRS